mmetsp:Transcript_89890/g.141962  ORF Transcript_89890/g.141962 Transcript_89890/m.141962 type:complete len:870 (+) Transcript_89890:61-2670(+)
MAALSVVHHPLKAGTGHSSPAVPLLYYGSNRNGTSSSSTHSLEASYVVSPVPTRRSPSNPSLPRSGSPLRQSHTWSPRTGIEQHSSGIAQLHSSPVSISARTCVDRQDMPRSCPRVMPQLHPRHTVSNAVPISLSTKETHLTPRTPRQPLTSSASVERKPVAGNHPRVLMRLPDGRLAALPQTPLSSARQSSTPIRIQAARNLGPDASRAPVVSRQLSAPSSARILKVTKSDRLGNQPATILDRPVPTVDQPRGEVRVLTDYEMADACYPSSLNNSAVWPCSTSYASSSAGSGTFPLDSFKELREQMEKEEYSPAGSARMTVPVCSINLFQEQHESRTRNDAKTQTLRVLGLQPEPEPNSSSPAPIINLYTQEQDNQMADACHDEMIQVSRCVALSPRGPLSEATICSTPTSKRTSPSVSREKMQLVSELAFNTDTLSHVDCAPLACRESNLRIPNDSSAYQDSQPKRNVVFEFSISVGDSSLKAGSEAAQLVLAQERSLDIVELSGQGNAVSSTKKFTLEMSVDKRKTVDAADRICFDLRLNDAERLTDERPDDGLSQTSHCTKEQGCSSEPSTASPGMEHEETALIHVDEATSMANDVQLESEAVALTKNETDLLARFADDSTSLEMLGAGEPERRVFAEAIVQSTTSQGGQSTPTDSSGDAWELVSMVNPRKNKSFSPALAASPPLGSRSVSMGLHASPAVCRAITRTLSGSIKRTPSRSFLGTPVRAVSAQCGDGSPSGELKTQSGLPCAEAEDSGWNDERLCGAIDAFVSGPSFQDVKMEARDILCRFRRDAAKSIPAGLDEADVTRMLWSRIYEEVGKQLVETEPEYDGQSWPQGSEYGASSLTSSFSAEGSFRVREAAFVQS